LNISKHAPSELFLIILVQRELICTTTEPPVTVDLNETNFSEMIAHADKQRSSVKVSFVGDTGAGKSLIITQLLKFDDRIRYARLVVSLAFFCCF
jgi:hypothetical protein